MTTKMVWDWRVPDIHEINRVLFWLNAYAEGGMEAADKAYQKQPYAHLPCWVKDESHINGLLTAVRGLWVLTNNCSRLQP